MTLFAHVLQLQTSSEEAALCTVVKISGSTPRKASAKMIVIHNDQPFGKIIGTIGGGAIEHVVRKKALEVIVTKEPYLFEISLRNELGMCCGGEMTIFIEPIIKPSPFICFGAGHIAQALCPLAVKLGFLVHVIDRRSDLLMHAAFKDASAHIPDDSVFSLNDLPFSHETFVVIATFDHDLDQHIVEHILPKPFKYAALVGSKRKALMTNKRLLAKGFTTQDQQRIICPAGIHIFAQTPEEIALSIAAQMVKVKNESKKLRAHDSSCGQQHAHG